MQHWSVLCLALALLVGCATPPRIEPARAAGIAIGDSVADLERAVPAGRRRSVDLRLEGMPAPAIEIRPAGAARADAVVAELAEQDGELRVFRLQVRDPLLRTARGVGDPVGALRAAYRLDRLIGGEGNVGIRVEALGATFLLDPAAVRPQWLRTGDPALVPDHLRIERILLTTPLPHPQAD